MLNKILIVLILLLTSSISYSDDRSYVWTYEYKTLERGEGEVEVYTTFSSSDINKLKGNMTAEHQVELEVGMTERFDIGIYQIFKQNPGESLIYDGFKIRGRYRIGDKGKFFIDPLLYLEYKGKPDFSEHGIELKFITAKDFENFNVSFNPILEFEYKDKWEVLPAYSLGTSYRIGRLFRAGLEFKGSENGHYIGPVISHGNEYLFVVLGSAFKISNIKEKKPEFQLRMLLGVAL